MPTPMLGALVEYGTDFLGPIPNVVIFQFNPESIARTLVIPPRAVDATQSETSQAGEPAYERFTITATFSAADQRNSSDPIGLLYGLDRSSPRCRRWSIPLRLRAARPGQPVDAIGSLLGPAGPAPTQPIPREQTRPHPFHLGHVRGLCPVIIESLPSPNRFTTARSIRSRPSRDRPCSDHAGCVPGDTIGQGALAYTKMVQDTMAPSIWRTARHW